MRVYAIETAVKYRKMHKSLGVYKVKMSDCSPKMKSESLVVVSILFLN